ncbi:MAG: hypothetical protein K6E47_13205 [Lachnospiraceae bacterium]|nr:hypothetical protein [Lachnospiraceae bacterium]
MNVSNTPTIINAYKKTSIVTGIPIKLSSYAISLNNEEITEGSVLGLYTPYYEDDVKALYEGALI